MRLTRTFPYVTTARVKADKLASFGSIRHGADPNFPRGTDYGSYIWTGYVQPLNARRDLGDVVLISPRPYMLPFQPASVVIPYTMAFWAGALDPNDPVGGIEGGRIQDFFDLSGNGHHASGSNTNGASIASQGPGYVASIASLGGRPAISFNGVDQRCAITGSSFFLPQPMTVIAVAQNLSLTGNGQALFGGISTTPSEQIRVDTNRAGNKVAFYAGGAFVEGAPTDDNPNVYADLNPHVYYAEFNGNATSYLQRDAKVLATGNAGMGALKDLALGYAAGQNYFNGYIALLLFIPGRLTAAEKAAFLPAIRTHYGLGA